MAETRRDYYEVLGVKRDADEKAIKDAFRQLALRCHPDRSKEPGADACPSCGGSGAQAGTQPKPCDACGGSGQQVQRRRGRGISVQQITTCAKCGGRGHVIEKPCAGCAATGEITREEELKVRIPVGVEEGMVLRVPGHGLPSRTAEAPAGDLLVVVATAPDPRFARDRADLWHTETVSVADAVLGAELQVPTLGGSVKLSVPPHTQPDTVLRLRPKGLPEFGDGRRGDLYVRIQIQIPLRLSTEERKLYERLRELARKVPGR